MNGAAREGHTGLAGDAGRQGRTGLAHDETHDEAHGGTRGEAHDEVHGGSHGGARDEAHGGAWEDRAGLAHDEVRDGQPTVLPALAAALGRELVRRVDEDRRLMREAHRSPTQDAREASRRRMAECRRDNAEALKTIVRRHGWPTTDLVGAPASTAALMILLHAPDLDFQLACRDLIAQATADGCCPAPHHAYIADHCAVELGEPQFYGTRVDPATFRPYPVRRPQTLDERRRDVGLCPLDEQMRTLRRGS